MEHQSVRFLQFFFIYFHKRVRKRRRNVVKDGVDLEEEKDVLGVEAPNEPNPPSAQVNADEHKVECNIRTALQYTATNFQ